MVFLEISGLSNNCGVTEEAGFWMGRMKGQLKRGGELEIEKTVGKTNKFSKNNWIVCNYTYIYIYVHVYKYMYTHNTYIHIYIYTHSEGTFSWVRDFFRGIINRQWWSIGKTLENWGDLSNANMSVKNWGGFYLTKSRWFGLMSYNEPCSTVCLDGEHGIEWLCVFQYW